jgi:hypothetical protein
VTLSSTFCAVLVEITKGIMRIAQIAETVNPFLKLRRAEHQFGVRPSWIVVWKSRVSRRFSSSPEPEPPI